MKSLINIYNKKLFKITLMLLLVFPLFLTEKFDNMINRNSTVEAAGQCIPERVFHNGTSWSRGTGIYARAGYMGSARSYLEISFPNITYSSFPMMEPTSVIDRAGGKWDDDFWNTYVGARWQGGTGTIQHADSYTHNNGSHSRWDPYTVSGSKWFRTLSGTNYKWRRPVRIERYRNDNDATAPYITSDPQSSGWTNSNIKIKATFRDVGCHEDNFNFWAWSYNFHTGSSANPRHSNWGYNPTGNEITLSTEGTRYLTLYAKDHSGNERSSVYGPYRLDKTAPTANTPTVTGAAYNNGNDYWVKPGDTLQIETSGTDTLSKLARNYVRLYGGGNDNRAYHVWGNSGGTISEYETGTYTQITGGSIVQGTGDTRKYKFNIKVKDNAGNRDMAIQQYFRDVAGNNRGWVGSGMNLKTDSSAPSYISDNVTGEGYRSGNVYWVKPNEKLNINFRQRDTRSGNHYQYLQLLGNGVDVRSNHNFRSSDSSHNNQFRTSSHVSISKATRTENTTYGRVNWEVTPKTHGHVYDINYYYTDNVGNTVGYNSTDKKVGVDGRGPEVTASHTSVDWTNRDILVSLNYSDEHTGVATKQYALTNTTLTPTKWSNYTNSINISEEGTWYIHYKSTDNLGNETIGSFGPYRIDKTKPGNSFLDTVNHTASSIDLRVSGYDTLSGLDFNSYRYLINGNVVSNWTNDSTYTFNNLSSDTEVTLGVEILDNAGNVANFTIVGRTLADLPGLSFGDFGTNNMNVTVERNRNPSSTKYELQRSSTSNFSGPRKTLIRKEDSNITVNDTGLNVGTEYFYRVRAINSDGVPTSWYTDSKYTRAVVPGIVTSVLSNDMISVGIDRKENPSDVEYYVQRSTDINFRSDITDVQRWSSNTTFIDSGLEDGTVYYYRVKARNGNNVETEWSKAFSDTTIAGSPDITSVEVTEYDDNDKNKSLVVSWERKESATGYMLYMVENGVEKFLGNFDSNTTSFQVDSLISNKKYEFKARTVNTSGVSNFGESGEAYTRAHSPISAKLNEIRDTSLTLDIIPATFTQETLPEYKLEITEPGKNVALNTPDTFSRETKGRTLEGLEPNKEYELWVYTRNGDGVENPEKMLLGDFRLNRIPEINLDNIDELYSEQPNYNKINIGGVVKDRDTGDTLRIQFTIFKDDVIVQDYIDTPIATIIANGGDQRFNYVLNVDDKLPEGNYSAVVKVFDELNESDEDRFSFKIDKTTPEGNLSIVSRGLYSAILNLNGVRDVNFGLHQNPILFEQKVNNGEFRGQGDWGTNTVLNTGDLPSNTKFTYRAKIRDVVDNTRISNEVAFVTTPILEEKDVYFLEEDPSTLIFDWIKPLEPNDGVSIEIRRSNTLIAVVSSGSRYIDHNLGYERDYTYTFTAVSEDSYGNRIESFPVTLDVTTGVPVMELVINEEYNINSDEYTIYTTKFSNKSRIRGTVFVRQGGKVDFHYSSGKSGQLELDPYETKRFEIIDQFTDGEVFDFRVELVDSIDRNKLLERIRVVEKPFSTSSMSGREFIEKTKD